MRPSSLQSPSGSRQIRVLSRKQTSDEATTKKSHDKSSSDESLASPVIDLPKYSLFDNCLFRLKPESSARCFKLIDEREWNIVPSEPSSETEFFAQGHSAMSIVSVLGATGVGKSSLLNKLAGREVFTTHKTVHKNTELEQQNVGAASTSFDTRHTTRGIDAYSTYHRILLDCQPMLASSILEDFLKNHSSSQFPKNTLISDPLTSCHMISLQLATFLIATSDYVIIMLRTLVDVHILKLVASAIMLIGEDNLRAKFIIFSRDAKVHEAKFKAVIDKCLGANIVRKYISDEEELYTSVAPYSMKKCDIYQEEPYTFTAKNWLSSCQRLWNSTIKGSSMFADYAMQVYKSNNGLIA